MSLGVLGLCLFCAAALGAGCASGAEEPARLVDAEGREHGLEVLLEDGPLLLVWVEPDCPIARAYVPELERIAADYAARGLRAALVDAHPTRDAGGLARAMSERGIQRYACYDDRGGRLARAAGVSRSPEVALYDAAGVLVYRGRIDDTWEALGARRAEPGRRDLRLALDALLVGEAISVPRTEAVGCLLPSVPSS